YESLAADDPVETAVAEGRLAMYRLDEKSPEWATPALFLGVRDGKILKFRKARPGAAPPRRAPPSEKPYRIGIRSFTGPGSWGREEVDRELLLDTWFDGRAIRQPEFWQTKVFPELRDFLLEAAVERGPLIIDFAAHASIAFAAGYCLNAKSGLDITIGQRVLGARVEWRVVNAASPETPLWCVEPDRGGDPEARDVALAVGITRPVLDDVELYLRQSGIGVHRILPATVSPEPGLTVVRDGVHALQLAQGLNSKIQKRTVHERGGWLHLFASAPNAVLFFLGQLSRAYGRIQLYEHNLESSQPGSYSPSIQLPPDRAP
ncbi:MAG TPA: SAVED domain-containing protein, partial [Thermoanaerobaculia bacterium]|nr:SAVED domain-containing protein [Thermoanaerobaculia bacterium]